MGNGGNDSNAPPMANVDSNGRDDGSQRSYPASRRTSSSSNHAVVPTASVQEVEAFAADANSTNRTTVETAEFPSMIDSPSRNNGLFDRDCLHGGPVTAATVRFPPPRYESRSAVVRGVSDGDADGDVDGINIDGMDERKGNQMKLTPKDRYVRLKSRGRIVFARGPWIDSHPLFPYDEDKTLEDDEKDVRSYKVLAFGGGNDCGSSTYEAVHGMIFPSSCSSLSYVHSRSAAKDHLRSKSSSLISIVAYGGRRISFLSGGGLWNESFDGWFDREEDAGDMSYDPRSEDRIDINPAADEFKYLSIGKSNRRGRVVVGPYLEVSDWIHDLRLLDMDCIWMDSHKRKDVSQQQLKQNVQCMRQHRANHVTINMLLALGTACHEMA